MRSTWCLAILAAAVVLAGGLRLSECGASGKRSSGKKAARQAPPRPVMLAEDVVDGYGDTAAKARAQALKHARDRIVEMLSQEIGEPSWQPPDELLDPKKLQSGPPQGWGVIEEVGKPEPTEIDGDKALVARYKVQLTSSYLQAVQTHARQERVGERHWFLVRILGGVLAVLLVTTGYLRLEEMTRGYYTRLLRLAAFAVLALAGLALLVTA
jgi:hypothetical protein